MLPEPGVFQPLEEPPLFDLRKEFAANGLQIIVKLANIELTPEKPEYEGGTWHVEGQLVGFFLFFPTSYSQVMCFRNIKQLFFRTNTFAQLPYIITPPISPPHPLHPGNRQATLRAVPLCMSSGTMTGFLLYLGAHKVDQPFNTSGASTRARVDC